MTVDKIYCADGMHGGVAVLLCGVDEIIEALLEKRKVHPSYRFYLELDGYTFEDWIRNPSPTRDRLKRALEDGCVELVSGAYTQPFAENIGLESNIRQLQWGKLLAKKALDLDIETYLIQEHAYHVALPQILLQLGYKSVVLRTHWPIWGQHKSYPSQAFHWQGADGGKILTIPHYDFLHFGRVPKERPRLEAWIGDGIDPPNEESIGRWLGEAQKSGIDKPLASREPDLVMPAVLKDETVKSIGEDSRLQFTTPGEHARMVKESATETQFIHPDDMDTTLPFGLQGDRVLIGTKKVENLLLAAEKFSTAAYLLSGRPYCNPNTMNLMGGQHYNDDLCFAWRRLMLAEQHDIWVCGPIALSGHSLEDRGLKWLEEAEALCKEILEESMVQILHSVELNPLFGKAAIAAFNPLPWSRTDVAKASLEFREGDFKDVAIVDSGGKAVPTQYLEVERYEDGSIAKAEVAFIATEVPAVGYKVYYATEQDEKASSDLKASEYNVENSKIIVSLDSCGIRGLASKANEQQLIAKDGVATRLVAFRGDEKVWVDTGETAGEIKLVESGPVFARYDIEGSTEIFNFRKSVTVYAYLPRVDVEDYISIPKPVFIGHLTDEPHLGRAEDREKLRAWHTDVFIEEEKLRSVVPFDIEDGVLRRNVVYVPSETKRRRFSSYDWADVSGEKKGLTLINKGNFRYFHDEARKELSLILAYSGNFLYSTGPEFHMMRGDYSFRYSLYPHESFETSLVNKAALEANNPLIVPRFRYSPLISKEIEGSASRRLKTRRKRGRTPLPPEFSFISMETRSGNISTMYLDEGNPVIRVYEDSGERVEGRIPFFKDITEAEVLDLGGRLVRRLPVEEGALKITLNPYEIATVRLKLA